MFSITEITYKQRGHWYIESDYAYRLTIAGSSMIMRPVGYDYNCEGGHVIEFFTVGKFLESFEIESEGDLTAGLPLQRPSIDAVMEPDFARHGG